MYSAASRRVTGFLPFGRDWLVEFAAPARPALCHLPCPRGLRPCRALEIHLTVLSKHLVTFGSAIRPAVGVDLDVVAATMIATIDQHIADAGFANFPEGDFLRVGDRRGRPLNAA